jgi:dihydroorotate dehydrogenase
MNLALTRVRNTLTRNLYTYLLKPILFMNDPEIVHDRMVRFGAHLGSYNVTRAITQKMFDFEHPMLTQIISGITFKNPIGLAAGFDKNAELTGILPSVGFGFMEVGSITGKACSGNPKPRLWRLKKSKSLLVYYGLKNEGCEKIADKLKDKQFKIPVGMSIAMTNCSDNMVIKNAVKDFAKAFQTMETLGSYITVNISCPNTQGGQPFIVPHNLDYLFDILDEIKTTKPIFVKISPDMSKNQINSILDVLKQHRVHGIICTNLTKNKSNTKIKDTHDLTKGGMSGKVVQDLSDELLAYMYTREKNRFIFIGCGGVFSAEDAYKKIKLGASLVQMVTGMIYEGPQVVSEINRGLVELLTRDGYKNIQESVGRDIMVQ